MPKPKILSLPNEIIQSIYLHCPSPSLPRASPIFASALSTDFIYRLTFFTAFWNGNPFDGEPAICYEPGPHVQTIFHPLPVPLPETKAEDARARVDLQEMVLGCRWCTFNNAKIWLEEIMQAVMKDWLTTFDLYLSLRDYTRFESFVAKLPANRSIIEAETLDTESKIWLAYPRPFATTISVYHYYGAHHRFKKIFPRVRTIAPTNFSVIPSHVLTGNPKWTQHKVDFLQMLTSNSEHVREVKYQIEAFHEGMRNAVIQNNYDALLTLVCLSARFAKLMDTGMSSEIVFEPRAELFCLLARRGMGFLAEHEAKVAETGRENIKETIHFFSLLIHTHGESMPQNDPDIEMWATRLLTWQYRDYPISIFAQWVLDWSKGEGRGQSIDKPIWSEHQVWVLSLFRESTFEIDITTRSMSIRFAEVCKLNAMNFPKEIRMGRPSAMRYIREGLC